MQVLLQDVYHTQPGVTCLILKLAADIVEAHISFVQVAPTCRDSCAAVLLSDFCPAERLLADGKAYTW